MQMVMAKQDAKLDIVKLFTNGTKTEASYDAVASKPTMLSCQVHSNRSWYVQLQALKRMQGHRLCPQCGIAQVPMCVAGGLAV